MAEDRTYRTISLSVGTTSAIDTNPSVRCSQIVRGRMAVKAGIWDEILSIAFGKTRNTEGSSSDVLLQLT